MPRMERVFKSEIQRLAKREVKATFVPLRREVRAMRLRLSGLSKNFFALDRLTKEHLRQGEKKELKLEATPEEVKASRLTPDRIRRLRNKLGISQRELGILTGAGLSAVAMWEKGKFKPRGEKKAALVSLRKLGKREVRKLIAEKAGSKKRGVKRVKKPQQKGRKARRAGPRRKKLKQP